MHHERPDGSGYHHGVSGAELPVAARILAAADAFQAMTQDRSYRPALSVEQAVETLASEAHEGRLDPECVGAIAQAAGGATPACGRRGRPGCRTRGRRPAARRPRALEQAIGAALSITMDGRAPCSTSARRSACLLSRRSRVRVGTGSCAADRQVADGSRRTNTTSAAHRRHVRGTPVHDARAQRDGPVVRYRSHGRPSSTIASPGKFSA
jgi:hypothetical protein